MGGNLWFMGARCRRGAAGRRAGRRPPWPTVPGVITPFPGGIAASGSKAGSRYKFTIASTYAEYLSDAARQAGRAKQAARRRRIDHGDHHQRPRPGHDRRRHAPAIEAAVDTPGLVKISAGNYGGRLGKSFIYLHPERQPA